ncbi:ankyrin repeat domain-containing protein [Chryseobacterium camelliae]|uniref:Ankyrin repeat domain-containing protein n=1 Tax=Chryseobacterium camelliae TaxID=1265445 RepID=A0ABY7QQI2_9FLAO|nr:ankyrin repeat domain-containing protein [Chryseobacterium camelliae]WBV61910.1 ankyrin repeat domain-containing protein [Chryseobacterium camelliae]
MKKIITTTLLFGLSLFANGLLAQEMSADQLKTFQTDNVENVQKVFKADDFTKCFQVKGKSYDLFSLSIKLDKKNLFNYFLDNKVDVNKSCSDMTPLMYAAISGQMDIAKLLLKHGAQKDAKDKNGKTAKDHALENKQKTVALIL